MTHPTDRRSFRMLLLGLLALAVLAPQARAIPTQPSASDRQIVGIVSMLMENRHLSRHRLDDEIAQRALDVLLSKSSIRSSCSSINRTLTSS